MSTITTHVLDTVRGKPAAGISIRLEKQLDANWAVISFGTTDGDGRWQNLAHDAEAGIYRLTFATADYLQSLGRSTVYPEIAITFHCSGDGDYHLPLLLSDNSYTTYRGS